MITILKKSFIGLCILIFVFLITLPFVIGTVSFEVLKPILTGIIVFIYIGLIFYILRSLFFSSLREKLMTLPFIVIVMFTSYIVYDFKLYYLVMNQFGGNYEFTFNSDMIFRIFDLVNPVLPIGIIISILPVVFFSFDSQVLMKPIRVEDISDDYKKSNGRLKSINATKTRVNKVRVYELEFDNVSFTENQTYIKKVKIPPHLIQLFRKNENYILYFNLKDIKKCYVKIENYLY